jgi:hypothetical protein
MFSKTIHLMLILTLTIAVLRQDGFSSQQGQKKRYSRAEIEKIFRVEKIAEDFVRRWQETLDLNVLFDEFYSSDEWIRRQNIEKYCDCYDYLAGVSMGTYAEITLGKVGLETKRKGFMAFWNAIHLRQEYILAFGKAESDIVNEPKEALQMEQDFEMFRKKYFGSDEERRIRRDNVKNFVRDSIALSEKNAAIYRKYLAPEVFKSTNYLTNIKLRDAEREPSRIIIDEMSDLWRLEKGRPIYYVQRGLFELYLIEENGRFRVLTFGYEL